MAKFQVLITDYAWPSLDIERQVLEAVDAELVVAETGDHDELIKLAGPVDAILTCWKTISPEVLQTAERSLVVSRYGIGLDNIPVDVATELGMIVTNVPDFCLDEVSDHVMALLLACARRICRFDRTTSKGEWNLKSEPSIPRLRDQTLGLIGFGNTAQAIVPKARGFGMNVVAYTPRLAAEVAQDGAPQEGGPQVDVDVAADLSALLRQSDYVSVHVPLTDETHRLIDAKALAQMKPSAFLINTSRGAVIDEPALRVALDDGTVAGAALDVLTEEPPGEDHPLLGVENAILTPHAAFYSERAIAELQRRGAENVACVLRGEIPEHVVNRPVLKQPNCRMNSR